MEIKKKYEVSKSSKKYLFVMESTRLILQTVLPAL